MRKETIVVSNPLGFRTESVGEFCRKAIKYKCSVTLEYKGYIANAKSVLSVLGACIKNGDEIALICEGEDEESAFADLCQFVSNGIGQ